MLLNFKLLFLMNNFNDAAILDVAFVSTGVIR